MCDVSSSRQTSKEAASSLRAGRTCSLYLSGALVTVGVPSKRGFTANLSRSDLSPHQETRSAPQLLLLIPCIRICVLTRSPLFRKQVEVWNMLLWAT